MPRESALETVTRIAFTTSSPALDVPLCVALAEELGADVLPYLRVLPDVVGHDNLAGASLFRTDRPFVGAPWQYVSSTG